MKKIVVSLVLSSLLAAQVSADTNNISIGASVGGISAIGIGANAKYKIDQKFGVRAGFDIFSVSDVEIEDGDLNYEFDATIQDFTMLVDWHPWGGSFRTSAGVIVNNSELDGTLTPSSNLDFEIQGQEFKASDVGSIDTRADFDPVAPYIGIGGDTSFNKDKGFGFTYDIGVIFQGSAKVDYTPHYTAAAIQTIKDDLNTRLEEEKKSLQEELDKYEILPYISIGFNYKF